MITISETFAVAIAIKEKGEEMDAMTAGKKILLIREG